MTTTPETAPAVVRPSTRTGPACAMVIFGASGDLTKRKLVPALHNLATNRLLSKRFAVLGVGRTDLSDGAFRDRLTDEIRDHAGTGFDQEVWHRLVERLHYLPGDSDDPSTYHELRDRLREIESERGTEGNVIFYLSTPPSLFEKIVRHLHEAGLTREESGKWRRVVIEKPFGRDQESARSLNRKLGDCLNENQIYRIDHYLGKETVQNILVFRFANGIFEPIWNRRYINSVQITVSEQLGVEHRASYYEEAGALRDMIPNHLVQLLSLTAMEPPTSFAADTVRNEKSKVLGALQPIAPEDVLNRAVRGQYGEGSIAGEPAVAYRSEPGVAADSATETYVALKFLIDNWRWADVPFYLRTGKRMPERVSEIAVQFKRAPFILFRDTPVDHLNPNQLVLRIQPREGIALSFGAKVPGPILGIGNVDMDFCYADYFGARPSTGYETLLYDCMNGDATLFQRGDNVEAAWSAVTPVLDVWSALQPRDFPNYAAGSWGPAEADELLARDGRRWRTMP